MKYPTVNRVLLAVCLFLIIAISAEAKSLNMAWDASPGPDVAGYNLYYKSGSASQPFNGSGAIEGNSPVDIGTNLSSTLSGLPDGQVHYIAVTAYDSAGYESSYSNVIISPAVGISTNQAPILAAIGSKTVTEGASLSFSISGTDPDGDSLSYSATGLPSGAVFNASTRTFSWVPNSSQSGNYSVVFSLSDGSLTDSETVAISVGNLNRAPVLAAIGSKTVTEGANLSFSISGSDPDGGSLSYSALALPGGAVFNASTRTFSWTPNSSQSGNYSVVFSLSDGSLTDSETVVISVGNLNRAPVLAAIGSKAVTEGANLSFSISGSDPDGGSLSYSATGLPGGAVFNASTRTFSWTPNSSQSGNYSVVFSLSDGSLTDSETVAIGVGNGNRAPLLTAIGSKTVNEGANLSFSISGTDPDGDSLIYSAVGLPSGAAFNAATLTFSWTPNNAQSGSYDVTFNVSDGSLNDTENVTISVGYTVPEGLSLSPSENGLAGVERVDGGDDSNNYVNGVPKADLAYIFRVVLRDTSGAVLPRVVLHLNGFAYEMLYESGTAMAGASYVFTTRLGPAAEQSFHFETRDTSGTLLSRFPADFELTGPQVELLNGMNIVGVSGNIDPLLLGSVAAIGTSTSFRWTPNAMTGSYELADSGAAVSLGEGYVMKRGTVSTLPSMAQFGENPAATHEIPVKNGWNLIANPYGGNVSLSKILIRIGSSAPMSWENAVASFLMVDGIYYYAGKDWGNRNIHESSAGAQGAILIPRVGYWVYVNSVNQTASLIVPKPQQ